MNARDLETFLTAYLTCILFSEADESTESGGEPLDRNFGIEDFSDAAYERAEADCKAFAEANWDDIQEELERAGHDFWFTRVGHGAGFWDGDWEHDAGKRLTKASKAAGHIDVYVGDDGQLYFM